MDGPALLAVVLVLRRLHTESGYGLRAGLWPTAVFPHAARTHHRQPRQSGLLKTILSKPVESEKIHLDTATGACVKAAVGHNPDRCRWP